MLSNKTTLLLDMNGTFIFGEDNFDNAEDFSKYYHAICGELETEKVNTIILEVYNYLCFLYPDEKYRHSFPSLEHAIKKCSKYKLSPKEIEKIIETFSMHEIGYIPKETIKALHKLNEKFTLGLVIDIWAPKKAWLKLFKESGISSIFSAASFSSDHGMVKLSPKPFELVVEKLQADKTQCLVIGDSARRDLGGAISAGIDCVLVGGAMNSQALSEFTNLLEFTKSIP